MTRDKITRLHLMVTIVLMLFIFVQSALLAEVSSRESNVFVTFLANILQADAERITFMVRKCAHFFEYLMLGVSLHLTVRDFLHCSGRQWMMLTTAWRLGTIYAVTDEFHQRFVPGRSCELRDVVIDSCGVAAGVLICHMVVRKYGR